MNEDIKETPLRKKFREYMAIYYNSLSKCDNRKDKVRGKFENKLWWKRFWIKFNLTNIPLFTAICALLTYFSITKHNANLLPQDYFLICLTVVIFIITIVIYLLSKRSYKKLLFKRSLKMDNYEEIHEQTGYQALISASNLVIELFIEGQYQEKYEKLKRSATKEYYMEVHNKLIASVKTFLKNNKVKTREEMCSFYESWYQNKFGTTIDNDKRLNLAIAKSKNVK